MTETNKYGKAQMTSVEVIFVVGDNAVLHQACLFNRVGVKFFKKTFEVSQRFFAGHIFLWCIYPAQFTRN